MPLTGPEMNAVWDLEDEMAAAAADKARTKESVNLAKWRADYEDIMALGKMDDELHSGEHSALLRFKMKGKGTSKFTSRASRLAE